MKQLWADHTCIRDRFIMDDAGIVKWLGTEFGITTRADALKRLTEIDPIAERIVIDGVAYQIPDECYRRLTP